MSSDTAVARMLLRLERDTETLGRIFANDLFYTTLRGVIAGKAAGRIVGRVMVRGSRIAR